MIVADEGFPHTFNSFALTLSTTKFQFDSTAVKLNHTPKENTHILTP
jgi:hypothetical protein